MKIKLFLLSVIMFLSAQVTLAQSIIVKTLEPFSTTAPCPTFKAEILQDETFPSGFVLKQGSVISGAVVWVEPPKRGKRDAYFEFQPTCLTYNGQTKVAKAPIAIAKVTRYSPIDPKKLAGSAAKTVAGYFIKGSSYGITFIQGVAQSENGDRLKNGVKEVYESTPLSFAEVGDELELNQGDIVELNITKINP